MQAICQGRIFPLQMSPPLCSRQLCRQQIQNCSITKIVRIRNGTKWWVPFSYIVRKVCLYIESETLYINSSSWCRKRTDVWDLHNKMGRSTYLDHSPWGYTVSPYFIPRALRLWPLKRKKNDFPNNIFREKDYCCLG